MNVTIEEETYLVTDQSLSRIQNKTTKQNNIDQNRCGCHLNGVARRRHQRHYPHAPQRRQCESHGKQTRVKKKKTKTKRNWRVNKSYEKELERETGVKKKK